MAESLPQRRILKENSPDVIVFCVDTVDLFLTFYGGIWIVPAVPVIRPVHNHPPFPVNKCLKPEAILDVQSVFVVIALNGLRKGILRCLENCGYREGLDYEYPFKLIPLMVLTKYTGGGMRMAEEMKYA